MIRSSSEEEPDHRVRWIVVHELAHIWLWPLGELAEEYHEEWGVRLQEQAATRIANLAVWQTVCRT